MIPEKIDTSNKHVRYQFTAYVGHVHSEMSLLSEYESAINIIIKYCKDTNTRIDVVSHPVLYMMRHSLELGYKSNFEYLAKYSKHQTSKSINKSHDLKELHEELKKHFTVISSDLKFDEELVNEFFKYYNSTTNLILDLGATEISSFRYTRNTSGRPIFKGTDTKDIGTIKELYDKAITMLSHTTDIIAQYTDFVDLLEDIPNFEKGTGKVIMTFPSYQINNVADNLDEKYEKIDQLKWKDTVDNQIIIVVTVKDKCYLTPIKSGV